MVAVMTPPNTRLARSIATGLVVFLFPAGIARAADCNRNGIDDAADIAAGTSLDCNADGRPDECELQAGAITFDESRVLFVQGDYYVFEPVRADLDGDGDIDIAATGTEVVLMFNRGDGVFASPEYAAVEIGIPGKPWNYIHGEDLDGDGDVDLVLDSQRRAEVAVLTNDGSGRFAVTQLAGLGGESSKARMTDIDLDGDLDLVSIVAPYSPGRLYNTIAVLRNRGDGSFDDAETIPVEPYHGQPVPVDLDGDGFPDLVSSYSREDEESGELLEGGVAIHWNAGDGTFLSPTFTPLGSWPRRLITADLDGDGDADIAAAVPGAEVVSILRNRGNGTFDGPLDTPAGGPADLLRAADLDADGDLDLITWEQGAFGRDTFGTTILSNDGSGAFAVAGVLPLRNVLGFAVADLDADGLPDLVAWFYLYGDPHIEVCTNLGGGSFGAPARFPTTNEINGVAPADLDGDGDLDLVASYPIQTLRNVTGDGSFALGCADFVRGDANADGAVSVADIVTITRFQNLLLCRDAADATDDERADLCDASFITRTLFLGDTQISAPYPAPGADPTPSPIRSSISGLGCGQFTASARAGCAAYSVESPVEVNDTVRIGDVVALPGEEVSIPIYVTTSEAVEGFQLVLEYDPAVLDFGGPELFSSRALDFAGSFYGQFPPDAGGWDAPNLRSFRADPGLGLAYVGIVGAYWHDGFDIPPGEEILVATLRAAVSPDATPGSLIPIEPTNGPGGNGSGPYFLKNELIHRGDARFVSVLPQTELGLIQIVGDQSYFVRGDSNGDWAVDISDPVNTLNALFVGGTAIRCPDAADSNDDGAANISDAVATLRFLFDGAQLIPAPFPDPGLDPTADDLRCLRLPRE